MKRKLRQSSGFTLTELIVTISIVAMLIFAAKPAMQACRKSFASAGAKSMISSALASARALAAKEQRYAGVRFQKAYHPGGPLEASQYMIFIVNEEPAKMEGLTLGFRTVEGLKPIKLPDSVGVMDFKIGSTDIEFDSDIDQKEELTDTTAFSIVFSSSGKLVIHDVRVRNRDGVYKPGPGQSKDEVFNSEENIVNHNVGMFIQDDYSAAGLGKEWSRGSFIIYDRVKFKQLDSNNRYTKYLEDLKNLRVYINPYTGTIIEK